MAVEIASTLAFLIGDWSIERFITDRHAGRAGRFSGTAAVVCEGGGAELAVYREAGQVSYGNHSGPARRTLRFHERADGSVRVDFQNGLPFLDLDLRDGACAASHPCRADTYELSFEVLDADRIRERWWVTGPAKDYEAETVWRRLSTPHEKMAQ